MKSQTVMVAGLVFVLSVSVCEAQLFKGGQRRAARQGGGNMQQSGGNRQQGFSNQQPRTGLFGKEKAPKTGGLFNKQRNQQPINNNQYQQPKTGLFGKEKQPKSGGLFNRNKVEYSDGQFYREKNGLFGKAKAKREQAAASQQRYTQQQFNQQASGNSVQRSQRASSNQSLFQNKPVGTFNNPTPGNSGSNGLLTGSSGQPTSVRPSVSQSAPGENSRLRQQVNPAVEDQKSQLPELTRVTKAKTPAAARAQKADAVVRSKPKLPQRRSPLNKTVRHARLQDTSKEVPQASPTGLIASPPVIDDAAAATLA